jgi:hypothetical protein
VPRALAQGLAIHASREQPWRPIGRKLAWFCP